MGKEIVYCVGCGGRLTEDDFDRRRAHIVDRHPYCARCRPVPEPPPPEETPPPRTTSSARRRTTTSHIPRATVPAPGTRRVRRSANPTVWIVGGIAAAVVLVAIVGFAVSGGSKREPPADEAPSDSVRKPPALPDGLEERLGQLERFAAGSTDPVAILLRCDGLRKDVTGTSLESRFKLVEARAVELRQREQERALELDKFLASIRKVMSDDPACERKKEVEGMLEAALKIAGTRAPEVERLKEDYRVRCEAAARPPEPPKAAPRNWVDCFTLAAAKIQANDYPGAKPLYLEGLATLPAAPPGDVPHLAHYVAGLYNIACIYAVEASSLAGAARKGAADQAFKYLDWSLRSGFNRMRCPCHAQTAGIGHMADDKDLDSLRLDPRYPELRKKYSN